MKRCEYDVVKLIEAVRERPCLWNKSLECYKDRMERKAAWNEIFNILDERYDDMTSEDQRLVSETVISKWTNIRDTFAKALKNKNRRKKHYMFYDNLKFLLQIMPKTEETDYNTGDYSNEDSQIHDVESKPLEIFEKDIIIFENSDLQQSEEDTVHQPKRKRTKREKRIANRREEEEETRTEIENEPVEGVENEPVEDIDYNTDDCRVMNEDEAFFASLLPTIVKYSEEERLEFRIEVLAAMKRISDKRKNSY